MKQENIKIYPDAVINMYERCNTNAYIVFKRSNDSFNAESIITAISQKNCDYSQLMDMYPNDDYMIIPGEIINDIPSGKQIINLYLS